MIRSFTTGSGTFMLSRWPLQHSLIVFILIVFNKNGLIKIYYRSVYHEGGDPLIPTCVTSNPCLIYSLNVDKNLLPLLEGMFLSTVVAAILFTCFRPATMQFSKRKLTFLKRQIERKTSKKHSTVNTLEI